MRVVHAAATTDLPADLGPDTLVVSADPEVLADAGRRGAHRLVVDGTAPDPEVLAELVAHLTHRSSAEPPSA